MLEIQRLTDENERLSIENNELLSAEEKLVEANKKFDEANSILEEANRIKVNSENNIKQMERLMDLKCFEYEQQKILYESKCRELNNDSRIAHQKRTDIETYIRRKADQIVQGVIDNLKREYKLQITTLKSIVGVYGFIILIIIILSIIEKKEFFVDTIKVLSFIVLWGGRVVSKVFDITTYISTSVNNINIVFIANILKGIIRYVLFALIIGIIAVGVCFGIKNIFVKIKDNLSIFDWYLSQIVILLVMFYGKYIKKLIPINLFILTLIVTLISIVVRRYIVVWLRKRRYDYKKYIKK